MATRDFTLGSTTSGLVPDNTRKPVFIDRTVDFGVAANSVNANDVCQMIPVPANFLALGVVAEVQTKEWSTSTLVEIGDGADPNGWFATPTINLNTIATNYTGSGFTIVGGTTTKTRAFPQQGGKLYTVADTIDMTALNTLNKAKVRVGVWGFMAK